VPAMVPAPSVPLLTCARHDPRIDGISGARDSHYPMPHVAPERSRADVVTGVANEANLNDAAQVPDAVELSGGSAAKRPQEALCSGGRANAHKKRQNNEDGDRDTGCRAGSTLTVLAARDRRAERFRRAHRTLPPIGRAVWI